MEVGEQAIYLARLKRFEPCRCFKKLRYWFEKFELQSWWRKKVEELRKRRCSKNVQSIVTIRHEPKLLILDEPFTGFDPINAYLIKDELLGTYRCYHYSSTHRMEWSVTGVCTLHSMNKIKKIFYGQVKDVRKQFRSNLFEIE